jgi:chaperone modulatory protein CbpM
MITRAEILLRIGIAEETFEAWCEAGWLRQAADYAEADLARAALIRDLTERLGVNEEGVDVALSLLDQIHGLRRALREVSAALESLPEPLRRDLRAALARPDAE